MLKNSIKQIGYSAQAACVRECSHTKQRMMNVHRNVVLRNRNMQHGFILAKFVACVHRTDLTVVDCNRFVGSDLQNAHGAFELALAPVAKPRIKKPSVVGPKLPHVM